MDNLIKEFSVSVFGSLEKFNETISKARCRIFYRGLNRNGSYITNEFAEKLIKSVPYTPVKGIYDNEKEDYGDHGVKRSEGRIYGIVPENPNFAWEDHEDEDGVVRTYACVDVLIFTALYEEAFEIIKKPQSMELYDKSIRGDWQIKDGKRAFVFEDGCFLGLQILGNDVEPCFEGAAFFSLYTTAKEIVNKLEEFSLNFQKKLIGGQSEMDKINFKLSDSQKHDALWALLNSNYNEEGHWAVEYCILDIYDEYAIVYNYANGIYERVYYTKDDSSDSVVINEKVRVYIIDVTEAERDALEVIKKYNNNGFEKIDEVVNTISTLEQEKTALEEDNSTYQQKIVEADQKAATLEIERDTFSSQVADIQSKLDAANTDLEDLRAYKLGVETAEKQELIEQYSDKLSEEILSGFSEKIGAYTYSDLKKELAFALVENTPDLFTNIRTPRIPKDEPKGGIEELLSKYKK